MRKNFKNRMVFLPLPVVMIGTYDENGVPNLMNAAWAGQYDYDSVVVSLSNHKTTDNFTKTGALTISFATKDTISESDYFGIISGNKINKIEKVGFHHKKSDVVNAPIFDEYPLTLECKVRSFDDGILIADVLGCSVDENYIIDGQIDVDKLNIITYDSITHSYRELGKVVGHAFSDGKKYN